MDAFLTARFLLRGMPGNEGLSDFVGVDLPRLFLVGFVKLFLISRSFDPDEIIETSSNALGSFDLVFQPEDLMICMTISDYSPNFM